MTEQAGLIIQGDYEKNSLTVKVVHEDNGDLSIYNIVQAGDGNDFLSGLPSPGRSVIKQYGVQLFGENGNDSITDSHGNDTLSGGAGDDAILSAYGHDIIDGGDGIDTLYTRYGNLLSSDVQTIIGMERLGVFSVLRVGACDLSQFEEITTIGRGTIVFRQAQTGELHFEAGGEWRLIGSGFDDRLDLSGQRGDFSVCGAAGADSIIGSKDGDAILGQGGDDSLNGREGRDYIIGGDGNDTLSGGADNDTLIDTHGNNTVYGGDGSDTITVRGGGTNLLDGGEGNDRIYLSNGRYTVNGGGGNDRFYASGNPAGAGWAMDGGSGEDTLFAEGNLADLNVSGIENLSLYGFKDKLTIGADALNSFDHIETSLGFSGLNIQLSHGGDLVWKPAEHEGYQSSKLQGSEEVDRIDFSASTMSWTVDAGGGNDVLTGGQGNNNRFSGGAGRDVFAFKDNIAGSTTIMDYDFSGNDRDVIDLSAIKSIHNVDDLVNLIFVNNYGVNIEIGDYNIILWHISAKELGGALFIL